MRKHEILELLKQLVNDLVNQRYEKLVSSGASGVFSAQELIDLINDYGGQVTPPPEGDLKNINIITIEESFEYVIEYELWIDGHKSDLTLSCIVYENESENYIKIENIHVL